jgi:Transmembrane secretion effector
VMSVGSVVGALAVARRTTIDLSFLVRAGTGLTLATAALAAAPSLPVGLLAALPVGYYAIFLIAGSNALVQTRADPSMRGRVLALFAVVFLGSTPLGSPVVGWLSEAIDPRAGLAVGSVAAGFATVWAARQLRRARTDPTAAAGAPVASPEPAAA